MHPKSHEHCEKRQYRYIHRRPCDEGRSDRRCENARAHGGYSPLFRRGPASYLPHPEGGKNRFGSTNEMGMFEMKNVGLTEVLNPSEIFLEERSKNVPGSAIVATMEGTRAML